MEWLIGGIIGLFSMAISSLFSKNQQKEQYELNSSLMNEQAGLNRQQYDYEYQKESPSARVRQYMEAGLNPALMYSNGVAGMQGSVSGVSGSSVGIPNFSSLANLSDSMLNFSSAREKEGKTDPSKVQMDNLKSLTNLNEANKAVAEVMPDKIKAETDSTKFATHVQKALESTTIEQAKTNLNIANESYKSLQEQVKQYKEQNKVLPERLQNDLKQQQQAIALGNVDVYLREKYGETEVKKNLAIMDATIKEIFSRIDVNDATVPQLKEMARKFHSDANYRNHIFNVLRKTGFNLDTGGGVFGMIEHLLGFLSDGLQDIF